MSQFQPASKENRHIKKSLRAETLLRTGFFYFCVIPATACIRAFATT